MYGGGGVERMSQEEENACAKALWPEKNGRFGTRRRPVWWNIEHEEESDVNWRCKFEQDLTGHCRPP